MKLSRFNSFIPYKGNVIAFNSLTQQFLVLKPMLHDLLMASAREEGVDKLIDYHPTYYNALSQKGFIVSDNKNENEEIKKLRDEIDLDETTYRLIINPTMNCNFKCWYCYESHIKDSKMTDETVEKVKCHIEKVFHEQKELKSFHLSWFGGEPLLYYKKVIVPISDFARNLFSDSDIEFDMSFTTNGYLVNDELIQHLKKFDGTFLQITLDGSKDQHNKIRYVSKNKGSYEEIRDNIILLAQNQIRASVRVNYTGETLETIDGILDDFQDLDRNVKAFINFSFHNVWQDGKPDVDKVEEIITSFRRAGFATSSQFSNVNSFRQSCYADKKNQATINFNGEVHKCTARDFTTDRAEGILHDDGSIAWNEKYYQRMDSKFKNSPCMSCRIQPICNGGCSQQAMEQSHHDY
ncbi:MAG: radical SAM protein, partial [Cyclobacteriaceae bacterium]